MLRITTSHSAEGAKKYFDVSLKTGDYYTRDIGTWGGKGAEMLGLRGEVVRKDFVALINNRWAGANPSFAVSSQILCLLIFCRLILKGLRSKKLGYGVCTDLTSFRSQ